MFFVLSKLLLIFIFPVTWIIVLLLISLFTKKTTRKKGSLIAAIVLLIVFTNPLILNSFAKIWDVRSENLPDKPYSCAIVLGGFTSVAADGKGFFNGSSDRFIQALELQSTGQVSKLLVSGGSPLILSKGKLKEADFVSRELKELKVPDSAVMIENDSRNTLENALFSKKILDKKGLKEPYVLVTSAFHMRRALYTFEKAGVKVIPYSCDYIAGIEEIAISDILPDAKTLHFWNLYVKEVVGYTVYYIKTL